MLPLVIFAHLGNRRKIVLLDEEGSQAVVVKEKVGFVDEGHPLVVRGVEHFPAHVPRTHLDGRLGAVIISQVWPLTRILDTFSIFTTDQAKPPLPLQLHSRPNYDILSKKI